MMVREYYYWQTKVWLNKKTFSKIKTNVFFVFIGYDNLHKEKYSTVSIMVCVEKKLEKLPNLQKLVFTKTQNHTKNSPYFKCINYQIINNFNVIFNRLSYFFQKQEKQIIFLLQYQEKVKNKEKRQEITSEKRKIYSFFLLYFINFSKLFESQINSTDKQKYIIQQVIEIALQEYNINFFEAQRFGIQPNFSLPVIDALTLFYFNEINGGNDGQQKGHSDFSGVQYVTHKDLKDVENISILKEELGTDFIEKQMYKQFTRNNNYGENEIKNKFQKNLYNDLLKQNNFLASMFLYFFHKFYYDDENVDEMNAFNNYKSADPMINVYKTLKTNGLPSAKIIEEIKTVYPFMHNLFVKLLQIKYGESANIALMNIQDAKEALKETELTGQIQKIKVKKPSKLELAKK